MSSEENMSTEPDYGLNPDQLILMKLSSSKQFALGALVTATNALVNTTVQDPKNRGQIENLKNVCEFLENSLAGAFGAVNDVVTEALEACDPKVTIEDANGVQL